MTLRQISRRNNQRPAIFLCMMLAAGCTLVSAPKPADTPQLVETATPAQPTGATRAVLPPDLAFSTPLVEGLSRSGATVLSVRSSTLMSMFDSTEQAAWIETDKGIVEVVFFADHAAAQQILIVPSPDHAGGRFTYTVQAPPPTLLHDRTIDASSPLYFTVGRGMFMVTSSEELDKTLKRMFSGT